ncbi:DUF3817 domain-containing protein [Bailinhaonella thermotolerans]|uniref:DUF3817 domain-containing protein n=1 Tax=Bailinhaonella thermotolerans TaxID=1070861 RepID=A0A3A4AXJ1_9ACTN|nr:DUF3817 domain-containing protein [Bailinhaonella thermotolerans]
MRSALKPFRILAYIVGVMLLLLVVAMVLKYGLGQEGMIAIVAPVHGFLYAVYLLAALNLGLKARWSWIYIVGVLIAGTIPFLSFVIERKVTARALAEDGAAATAEGTA